MKPIKAAAPYLSAFRLKETKS